MSNLIDHANRELDLLGYPAYDPENPKLAGIDMNYDMRKSIIDLVTLFSTQGHSGFSASYTIQSLQKLLRFENLVPLTDDPDEWQKNHFSDDPLQAQNRRNGEAFTHDGGKTYYLLSERRRWVLRVIPWVIRKRLSDPFKSRLMYPFHTSKISGKR